MNGYGMKKIIDFSDVLIQEEYPKYADKIFEENKFYLIDIIEEDI
jgi:hypothetical protein